MVAQLPVGVGGQVHEGGARVDDGRAVRGGGATMIGLGVGSGLRVGVRRGVPAPTVRVGWGAGGSARGWFDSIQVNLKCDKAIKRTKKLAMGYL